MKKFRITLSATALALAAVLALGAAAPADAAQQVQNVRPVGCC
ncbi:hypothetical protein [Nocardioides panacisoli]|uniref:Uncharacterized protein n=1 Tax=Nocardioides panacisoli TaxID=627624 RepID=A0ABP7IQG4_9ACTN